MQRWQTLYPRKSWTEFRALMKRLVEVTEPGFKKREDWKKKLEAEMRVIESQVENSIQAQHSQFQSRLAAMKDLQT
jgi:predicted alpha/beta hydrolase family esterase